MKNSVHPFTWYHLMLIFTVAWLDTYKRGYRSTKNMLFLFQDGDIDLNLLENIIVFGVSLVKLKVRSTQILIVIL